MAPKMNLLSPKEQITSTIESIGRILLTDNTRITTSLQQCEMKRYLKFDAFGTGFGTSGGGVGVEALVGSYVHKGIEIILKDDKANPAKVADYQADAFEVEALANVITKDHPILHEYKYLVEALILGWYEVEYPYLKSKYEVVNIEKELSMDIEIPPLLTIRFRAKPDIILRDKDTRELSIHDFKTLKAFTDFSLNKFKVSIQQVTQMLAAEEILEEPVVSYFIHGIARGEEGNQYDPTRKTYTGARYLKSPLVWGYYREPNPPLVEEDWQHTFMYEGSDGKKHKRGDEYVKTAVYEHFENPAEWIAKMDKATLKAQFAEVGPYYRNTNRDATFIESIIASETTWDQKLNVLSRVINTMDPVSQDWKSPEFQRVLSRVVPRSFNCFQFGRQCEYYNICFKGPGWEEPLKNGYARTIPHYENKGQNVSDLTEPGTFTNPSGVK